MTVLTCPAHTRHLHDPVLHQQFESSMKLVERVAGGSAQEGEVEATEPTGGITAALAPRFGCSISQGGRTRWSWPDHAVRHIAPPGVGFHQREPSRCFLYNTLQAGGHGGSLTVARHGYSVCLNTRARCLVSLHKPGCRLSRSLWLAVSVQSAFRPRLFTRSACN